VLGPMRSVASAALYAGATWHSWISAQSSARTLHNRPSICALLVCVVLLIVPPGVRECVAAKLRSRRAADIGQPAYIGDAGVLSPGSTPAAWAASTAAVRVATPSLARIAET
jgi:hypothetical protein